MSSIQKTTLIDYDFQSNFFKTSTGNIHYLDEGKGEVFVLVHGNPTWSFFYRKLITSLSKKNRVIAIDNLGCGLSQKSQNIKNFSLAQHTNRLTELLEHLKISNANFISHDWGGSITSNYCLMNKQKVHRMIYFNTSAFIYKNIPFRISVFRIPIIGKILLKNFNLFVRGLLWFGSKKKLSKEVKKGFLYPYQSSSDRVAIDCFVKDIPSLFVHNKETKKRLIEMRQELSKINVPTLFCWGDHDWCFCHKSLKIWKEIFPHAQVKNFPAGHLLLEDCFTEIDSTIEQFLNETT